MSIRQARAGNATPSPSPVLAVLISLSPSWDRDDTTAKIASLFEQPDD